MIELPAAPEPRILPRHPVDPVLGMPLTTGQWGATTVGDVLARHEARGLVVLHRGQLAVEWYGERGAPDRRHLCYSVTKSLTGTLAALAIADGRLDRDATVGALLPELAASGFADATVGQVADMTASIAYDEDYDDAEAGPSAGDLLGFGDYMAAVGLGDPSASGRQPGVRAFLAAVPSGAGPHGEAFAYATPVTDVLAWALERGTGVAYTDLLRDELWRHVGAEFGADLLVDAVGTPLAGGGLRMATRDLARFGQWLLGDGVPPRVLESIRAGGSPEAFARSHYAHLGAYTYRDQWWLPDGPSRPLSAWGIHGQLLWVDPDAELVVACHCVGPAASDERRDAEQDAMCRALTAAAADWDPAGAG